MSKTAVPAGKWRLRPYDPQCKTFVDIDPVVEEQIRCKVPEWTGDFDEVKPELIAGNLRLEDLPQLTVRDVGQFVIRAAQGGALKCGPVGTARHTIVAAPSFAQPAAAESWHAQVARRLETIPRRVLWFMYEMNALRATDKLTRTYIADALHVSIDVVASAGEAFRACEKPLIESERGPKGGWYLLPDGASVAEHCAPPTCHVAPVTQAKKAR